MQERLSCEVLVWEVTFRGSSICHQGWPKGWQLR